MLASQRIATTHTGSLARSPDLSRMLLARAKGEPIPDDVFEAETRAAVHAVVARQCAIGLDIVNDGEQSKIGFAHYVRDRLDGFGTEPEERVRSLEARQFKTFDVKQIHYPCVGPLTWKDFKAVENDIQCLTDALAPYPEKKGFMTAVSPGTFANRNPNRYYRDRTDYLTAIVDVMRREYEAIAAAGFILQLDSPDLGQHSYNFPDLPKAEWLKIVAENVEAANAATSNIPTAQVRIHVCWGTNDGPHNYDSELIDIVQLLMKLQASALSVVGANGRHAHEWAVWKTVRVPEGMSIIPGVIDSTSNIVEHPETVAERLQRFASAIGRERIIAGVDCGFGTHTAHRYQIDPEVAWAKLSSLVQGAEIASRRLWGEGA